MIRKDSLTQTQLHLSIAHELIETVRPIENPSIHDMPTKPIGGLWTSTWIPETHGSSWTHYAASQPHFIRCDQRTWHLLTPSPDARVFTINGRRNLDKLYQLYKKRDGSLHFEAMAVNYDALHLTNEGIAANYEHELVEDWSCESTVWFRWCFENVRRIEVPVLI